MKDLAGVPEIRWDLSYRDGDTVVLVEGLEGLTRYLAQQPEPDGDLDGAIARLVESPIFDAAPPALVREILARIDPIGPLPRHEPSRRVLGDGTARGGYGRAVFERDGYRCRYCGYDLGSSYRAWLQLSVDHVIPSQMKTLRGYPAELIDDTTNLVTCCRSCNDFGNRRTVADPFPGPGVPFFDLRDRVYPPAEGQHLRSASP